jgi:hypothetical protein
MVRVLGALVTSLQDFVTEILKSRDFAVGEREGHLLAKKGEAEVIFCLIGAGEERSALAFLDKFRRFHGKKVIVTLVQLPEIPPEKLDPNLMIWDREALAQEVGRVHLERLVGDKNRGLVDDLLADDYPKMVSPEELSNLKDAEVGERIVRPTIDVQDVKEIGMRTVGGFRHRLELVPYHVFDYSCVLYSGDRDLGEEKGRLAVNALTSKVEEWSDRLEVVYALEQGHRRLEPSIDQEAARSLVQQQVMKVHTQEQEVVRDESHATVVERRKVSPRPDQIALRPLGIYYLPVWCVEGVHGVMIVNAGTGKIISEDYYQV